MIGPGEVAAVSAVAALALLMRYEREHAERDGPRSSLRSCEAELRASVLWSDSEEDEPLAIDSEGYLWLTWRHGLHRVAILAPEFVDDDEPRVTLSPVTFRDLRTRRDLAGCRVLWLRSSLRHGDFTGARVVRGAPDFDPWRLEALGPDGEYMSYAFEIEEAARAALAQVMKCVVKRPRDFDGTPIPMTWGDFEEGRLRWERTLHLTVASMMGPGAAS